MNIRKSSLMIAFSFAVLVCVAIDCVAQSSRDAKTGQTPSPGAQNNNGLLPQWIGPLLVSILGGGAFGGVVVTLLNMWHSNKVEGKRRRTELLDSQLREFYGPLQFFASCNQRIFGHTWKIEEAGQQEYGGPHASPARTACIDATISVNNEYFALANANNRRMVEIITNHYALIAPDDAEAFAQFLTDCLRHETEFDESRKLKLPLEVYGHLGDICSLRPELVELIDRRFKEKKAELLTFCRLLNLHILDHVCIDRRKRSSRGKRGFNS